MEQKSELEELERVNGFLLTPHIFKSVNSVQPASDRGLRHALCF